MDNIQVIISRTGMGGVQLRTKRLYRSLKNHIGLSAEISLKQRNAGDGYLSFLLEVLKEKEVKLNITVFGRDALMLSLIAFLLKKSIRLYHIQAVPIELPATNPLKNLVRRLGCKILVRVSQKVICVSKAIEKEFNQIGKEFSEKITCIYNPILGNDFELRRNFPNSISFKFRGALKLVSVGRISKQKNFSFLLDVVACLVSKGIDVELAIIGPGNQAELSKRIILLNLFDKVNLLGELENPLEIVSKADVFCLCSLWEGFPSVLVESIFLGTPVVSVNCRSGPSEIITEANGALCEVYSVQLFTDTIISVNQKRFFLSEMQASVFDLYDYVSAEKHAAEVKRCISS